MAWRSTKWQLSPQAGTSLTDAHVCTKVGLGVVGSYSFFAISLPMLSAYGKFVRQMARVHLLVNIHQLRALPL